MKYDAEPCPECEAEAGKPCWWRCTYYPEDERTHEPEPDSLVRRRCRPDGDCYC